MLLGVPEKNFLSRVVCASDQELSAEGCVQGESCAQGIAVSAVLVNV